MALDVEPASDAGGARWVEDALGPGDFAHVEGVAPAAEFEAAAAILHPMGRSECTEANVQDFHAGRGDWEAMSWSEAASAGLPVLYGVDFIREGALTVNVGTQYRRIGAGWIVDRLPDGGASTLIRPGDRWVGGPSEGHLPRDIAATLLDILAAATTTPASCWFGVWDGFGWFGDEVRAQPAIATRHRRWLLYRGGIGNLIESFDPYPDDDSRQSANLLWPDDRAFFLATEIDAEATLVAGSRALIDAIVATPSLETRPMAPGDRLPRFGELLEPVVEAPEGLALEPAFEARAPAVEPARRRRLLEWAHSEAIRRIAGRGPASATIYYGSSEPNEEDGRR